MQITKEFCVSVDDSNENICLPVKGKYVSHKINHVEVYISVVVSTFI